MQAPAQNGFGHAAGQTLRLSSERKLNPPSFLGNLPLPLLDDAIRRVARLGHQLALDASRLGAGPLPLLTSHLVHPGQLATLMYEFQKSVSERG